MRFFTSALLLASSAHAALNFTSPAQNATLYVGGTLQVNWTAPASGPALTNRSITFDLMHVGKNTSDLTPAITNITSVPERQGSFRTALLHDLSNGTYVLRVSNTTVNATGNATVNANATANATQISPTFTILNNHTAQDGKKAADTPAKGTSDASHLAASCSALLIASISVIFAL